MTIAGDHLNDYDWLIQNGEKCGEERMKKTVKDSQKILSKKLMEIQETGPTAMGPAVATAVAMASKGAAGS